jgi:acyl carrier protein
VTRSAIQEKAAGLLSALLGRSIGAEDVVVRADESRWDSIRHLELVFTLEDAFDVRFDAAELPALDSLEAIVDHLERHLVA